MRLRAGGYPAVPADRFNACWASTHARETVFLSLCGLDLGSPHPRSSAGTKMPPEWSMALTQKPKMPPAALAEPSSLTGYHTLMPVPASRQATGCHGHHSPAPQPWQSITRFDNTGRFCSSLPTPETATIDSCAVFFGLHGVARAQGRRAPAPRCAAASSSGCDKIE